MQLFVKVYFDALSEDLNLGLNIEAELEPFLVLQELLGKEVDNTSLNIENRRKRLRQMVCDLESVLVKVKTNIGEFREDNMSVEVNVLKKYLTSLIETFAFERLHSISKMPTNGSIFSIQDNVMGHGKPSKKHEMREGGKTSDPRPPSKHPPHSFIFISKHKSMIFPKNSKATCIMCLTKTMVEKENTIVCCCNCDKEKTMEET